MKKYFNLKDNKGYAILFTVVLISTISIIAFGMSNTVYKQLILSSVARDSQTAFYEADTASECAIYSDAVLGMDSSTFPTWTCGIDLTGADVSYDVLPISGYTGYELRTTNPSTSSLDPCVNATITKQGSDPIITTVRARGYNICNKSNRRTLERAIEISY